MKYKVQPSNKAVNVSSSGLDGLSGDLWDLHFSGSTLNGITNNFIRSPEVVSGLGGWGLSGIQENSERSKLGTLGENLREKLEGKNEELVGD